jgi:excinuclease ABC subunit C
VGEAAAVSAASAASEAAAVESGDAPVRPGETYQDFVLNTDEDLGDDGTEIRPERVFVPGAKEAIRLRPGTSELYLMTQLRDEAHRFAITHHRKRRGKRALHSALDDIPGVGPAIKKTLLQTFGSVAGIVAADDTALAAIKGVGPALVKKIREALGST